MESQRTDPIRQAVSAGEFQRATLLWNEYVTEMIEDIGRGTCNQARLAEAGDLLEWSRGVVLCERAHTQSRLNAMWVASQYGPADSSEEAFLRASL